jgi:hypothetical protein
VLLADSGGLGELARRFEAGVLFEAGNVTEFVQRLEGIAANYDAVHAEFAAAGARLLRALDLPSYFNVMETLIRRAVAGTPFALQWLGSDAAAEVASS